MLNPIKRPLSNWLHQFAPLRWGLLVGQKLFAPRQPVGVVGAIFNDAGQVLLVEHVFRPHYAWGLPGGWIEKGEHPATAIQRELAEELKLAIVVKKLLLCENQGGEAGSTTPKSVGLAYYCRPLDPIASSSQALAQAASSYEVLGAVWVDPDQIEHKLLPLQAKAIQLAQQAFAQERPGPSLEPGSPTA